MSDPIRWLDEGAEALPHERALLSSGRGMDPPPGAQEKVWAALQVHIGPGGGPGGGSSGNAATNGTVGSGSSGASITGAVGGVKAAIVGLASVVAIAGAIAAFVPTAPADPIKTEQSKSPMVDEPPIPNPEASTAGEAITNGSPNETITPSISPAPLSADAQHHQKSSPRVSSAKAIARETPVDEINRARQERASRLREENRILGDARAALRSGDSASALEKLEAMSGKFPDGVLAQEREVLAIEALARAGQRTAASARAAAFLQAYPTSPHAKKVRAFLQ